MTDTTNQHKIERIVSEDYTFKFGKYITDAVAIFQRSFFGFVMLTLVIIIGLMFSSVIPMVSLIMMLIIAPVLNLGYAIQANKLQNKEVVSLNDMFLGFSKIQPLSLVLLFMSGIYILSMIPLFYYLGESLQHISEEYETGEALQAFAQNEPEEFLALVGESISISKILLYCLPIFFINIIYLFAPMMVFFYDLSPWKAMEASRKIIMKKWFTFLGFSIVVGIIGAIGIFFFGVGILFTYPIIPLAMYIAFADVTKLNESSVENDILNHLVE